jgi:hypothetical protein
MPQAALYRHRESWILQTSSPSFLPMLLHLTVSQYLFECFVNAHCKGTIGPPLSEQVTETMEQLSTIISKVACFQGESCCQTYSVTEKYIHGNP